MKTFVEEAGIEGKVTDCQTNPRKYAQNYVRETNPCLVVRLEISSHEVQQDELAEHADVVHEHANCQLACESGKVLANLHAEC